jgi:hypothetical protein
LHIIWRDVWSDHAAIERRGEAEAALDRIHRQSNLCQPVLAKRHQRGNLTAGRMSADEQPVW